MTESSYQRYEIEAESAPDIVKVPPRFRVKTRKHKLIALALKELVEFKGNAKVAMSRPCMYGVFGRVVGGLAPIEEKCVGCLRCTVEYPDVVQIYRNPDRAQLGDSYLRPEFVDTILYEAESGRVPVKGQGYRGAFGGEGFDGMWLDMSEIVRPTRDGIHGREYISTAVDIGEKPMFLRFDEDGEAVGDVPKTMKLQVPFLFGAPPVGPALDRLADVLVGAAGAVQTLALVPVEIAARHPDSHAVPVAALEEWDALMDLPWAPKAIELRGWSPERFAKASERFPNSQIWIRIPADYDVVPIAQEGARVIHLAADLHGRSGGEFILDLIMRTHRSLVDVGLREQVTLIASGGIVAAEHVPKAIVAGLDAVVVGSATWVALHGRFEGEAHDPRTAPVTFPEFDRAWGVKRLTNLTVAWRDQLLEVMGAMGIREVRRLRGEIGRCMFQTDLEADAFGDIEGFVAR
ncbi:MAG: glutamate synthase-related protein [Actinomycetota bacterium]